MNTENTMRAITRRIRKLEDMSASHCGHQESVWEMFDYEEEVLAFIRRALADAEKSGREAK
jgi:hypothetical protein